MKIATHFDHNYQTIAKVFSTGLLASPTLPYQERPEIVLQKFKPLPESVVEATATTHPSSKEE
jgi:hypothetical protein